MQGLQRFIVGLGSPLLDLQAFINEDFLARYGLTLNNTYFPEPKHMPLYDEIIQMPEFHKTPGGSTLNTMRMAQWMLQNTTEQVKFLGCIGNDIFANMLTEVTLQDKVDPVFEVNETQPTGKCAVLLHDKDRCLVPLIGAAGFLSDSFVDSKLNLFQSASILFSEVYFLYAKPDIMHRIYDLCTTHGVRTCLTLSSQNAVSDMLEHIKKIWKSVDIVFGNEEEVKQFGLNMNISDEDLGKVAQKLAALEKTNQDKKRIVVVTRGKLSTLVSSPDEILEFPVTDVLDSSKIVDANAAGDSFAGGFVSQLFKGESVEKCVRAGQYAALQCIQQPGSQLPPYKPQFE